MFDQIPQWIFLLHGFITAILTVWLGLRLVNIAPNIPRILIIGVLYAIFSLYIRTIDCPYGLHVFIQLLLLTLIVKVFFDIFIFHAILAVILGFSIFSVAEAIFVPLVFNIFGLTAEKMLSKPIYYAYLPLPQILVMLAVIAASKRYDLHLIDLDKQSTNDVALSDKQQKTLISLIIIFLINILATAICNVYIFDQEVPKFFKFISLYSMGYILNTVLLITLVVGILLINELIRSAKKEALLQYQAEYIDTFDELYNAIRAEKHDMINHLQTILGFTQLGLPEEIESYLKELLGQQVFSTQSIFTSVPAITSLLFIKSNLAASKNTQFNFVLNGSLNNLSISHYELNKILGNLINNALDAVSFEPSEKRKVQVTITEETVGHSFEVLNPGKIAPEQLANIFAKGYSTKGEEHLGIGLYTVRVLVEKNSGTITANNTDQGVLFAVYIPYKK